jgi:DNA replication protein DnaC
MLNHPTRDKLLALKLPGMAAAWDEQRGASGWEGLTFEERLGLLVDREMTQRENRQLAQRLKAARLRQSALAEEIDFRHRRGLDRALMLSLLGGHWLRTRDNCIITGPTGVGKSYLACALAHQACRSGAKVLYTRLPRLLSELALAHADGSFGKRLFTIARCDLLVLDDWGLEPFSSQSGRDLLEVLDDRYQRKSTLVAAQIPQENWHQQFQDPTTADAALDRLVHNAHQIKLSGESLRKTKNAVKIQPGELQTEAADSKKEEHIAH